MMNVGQRISFKYLGLSYLEGSGIEFDLETDQIIWAPNGTAKSSICRAIAARHPQTTMLVDYDSCLSSFKRRNKKSISIGTSIQRISELETRLAAIDNEAGIRNALKAFGISNASDARDTIGVRQPVKKLVVEFDKFRLTDELLTLLNSVRLDEARFFIGNLASLNRMSDISAEIDLLKQAYIQQAIELVESASSLDSRVCPICGSSLDSTLFECIRKLKCEFETLRDGLAVRLSEQVPLSSALEAEDRLDRLAATARMGCDTTTLLYYCMAEGDKDRADQLQKLSREKHARKDELRKLSKQRDESFKRLRGRESQLRALLMSRFGARSMKVDEKTKTIQVDFNRPIQTYSTGEINLMLLLTKIQEFRSGDIKTLLVDDPLSSLDVANQYQVMFDLISATVDRKAGKVLMLTHNLNALNVAMSQNRGAFKLFGMERIGNRLTIKPIPWNGSLTFKSFLEQSLGSGERRIHDVAYYLEAVSTREETVETEFEANLHEVFHYRMPGYTINYKGVMLSNDYLIKLFENYNENVFDNLAFAEMCTLKAVMLIASRVWLERELRVNALREVAGKQLGEIIDELFPRTGAKYCACPEAVNRQFLMRRKTLFNQSAHEGALLAPFEFATNISINDLTREISEIKRAFGCF